MRESGAEPTPIEDCPPEVWSETNFQLANVQDLLAHLAWLYVQAHQDPRSTSIAAPDPVGRPGMAATRPRGAAAWFSALGAGST